MKKIILEIDKEVIRKVENFLMCKRITRNLSGEDDALLIILITALEKNLERVQINKSVFTSILNILLKGEL
uniref:Uncharacterized protein n=1 Tax=viral metagenome TaxID=1070528 RepID=A0A6H2A589_9ZZZZ